MARLVAASVAVFAIAVLVGVGLSLAGSGSAPKAAPIAPLVVAIPPEAFATPAATAVAVEAESTPEPSMSLQPEVTPVVVEARSTEPTAPPARPAISVSTSVPSTSVPTEAAAPASTATAVPPPTAAPVAPASSAVATAQFQRADDLEMAFTVAPGLAGSNDLNFFLRDVDGDDRPYERLVARVTYLDSSRGTQAVEPVQLHEGHWPIDGADLGLAGRWRIEASVSRSGLRDTNFSFELRLAHR